MTILLVLVILYAIFIGFYGVNKLNKFLTEVEPRSDYYQKPQLDENAAEVLILGKADEVSPFVAKLSEDHIQYKIIEADNEALYKKNDISFSRNSDHWEDAFYKKINLQIPVHR